MTNEHRPVGGHVVDGDEEIANVAGDVTVTPLSNAFVRGTVDGDLIVEGSGVAEVFGVIRGQARVQAHGLLTIHRGGLIEGELVVASGGRVERL